MVPLLMIGLTAAALLAVQYFSEDRRLARLMRSTPLRPIAEGVEARPCRYVGKVAPGHTMRAPISGRPCVCYQVRIFEDMGGAIRHFADDEGGIPFTLEDDSGRALVEPKHTRMSLDADANDTSGPIDGMAPHLAAYLTRIGRTDVRHGSRCRLQYHEGIVAPGETVSVLGVGVREPDPRALEKIGDYRTPAPTRLRINGSARWPVLISDRLEAR